MNTLLRKLFRSARADVLDLSDEEAVLQNLIQEFTQFQIRNKLGELVLPSAPNEMQRAVLEGAAQSVSEGEPIGLRFDGRRQSGATTVATFLAYWVRKTFPPSRNDILFVSPKKKQVEFPRQILRIAGAEDLAREARFETFRAQMGRSTAIQILVIEEDWGRPPSLRNEDIRGLLHCVPKFAGTLTIIYHTAE